MDIQVQSFLNSATKYTVAVTNATTVAQLKTIINGIEGVNTSIMSFHYSGVELANTGTMATYAITTGSIIGSSNTISLLPTKEERQLAKLDLAQLRRQAGGNTSTNYYRQFNVYDADLLADKYVGNTTAGTTATLVLHRPWTT